MEGSGLCLWGFQMETLGGGIFKSQLNCHPDVPMPQHFRKPYYEQQFLVSAGVDCDLEATLYTRISNRKILTWIQRITGKSIVEPKLWKYRFIFMQTKQWLRSGANLGV